MKTAKESLYTIYVMYRYTVLLLLHQYSIQTGQGVHHHSFATFFGVSFCVVQQRFLHTDGACRT